MIGLRLQLSKKLQPKPVYEYELIEKVVAESNKKVVKYAIVEFAEDLEQYYIESSEDRLSTKILLDQYKTGNFHLEIGDVVDYAYWNDEILSGKNNMGLPHRFFSRINQRPRNTILNLQLIKRIKYWNNRFRN